MNSNVLQSEKLQNIGKFQNNIINDLKQILSQGVIKKIFLTPFYGWDSTVSRLYRTNTSMEAVYFLPLI